MVVYQVTNKSTGKKYIGQHVGTDLQKYWLHNVYLAQNGYQGKRLLYRAICKYGPDAFEIKPLLFVQNKEELDFYEISLIKSLETTNPQKGYNITKGGGGSLGVKMSEETRCKMSTSRTGLIMPESHRRKLSERSKGNKYALGRKMTKDNFDKLMAVHIGAKRTEESKRKMSEAHVGKSWTEKQKQARHIAVHTNRNVVNPKCKYCKEGTNNVI